MTEHPRETDGVDEQTMRLVADSAALRAAQAVAGGLRSEMQEGLASLESNIASHMELVMIRHFGGMDPATHIQQHTRLELFLKRIDDMQSGFWKGIAGTVAKYLVILLIAGAVAYFKLKN